MCYIITLRMLPSRTNIFAYMSKPEQEIESFGMIIDGGCYATDL